MTLNDLNFKILRISIDFNAKKLNELKNLKCLTSKKNDFLQTSDGYEILYL